MSKQNLPFMSVVVIGYNSAKILPRTFKSLLEQDYPKDRFEVVFVNDGSSDNTDEVMPNFPAVRYVKLPKNAGQAAARNAGLEVAKGDVLAAFDSDCVAAPGWLAELARGYSLPNPAGVGGIIVDINDKPTKGIATHYIEATGRGATAGADRFTKLPAFARRLLAYLTSGLAAKTELQVADHEEVTELYGANSSFPIEVLRKVGGWDAGMAAPAIGGIEDRDLCARIMQAYPDRHFYAMNHARMMHDPSISLRNYLLRPYRRGPFNYLFHAKNNLTPPIFPFPPFIALILLATALIAPIWLLPAVLLLPQLCYFWWLQRAIIERQPLFVLFPYVQLAEETMVIAGLIRGFFVHNIRKHEAR
jgi:glycosyltransferase involved in cell wall biosynthesis